MDRDGIEGGGVLLGELANDGLEARARGGDEGTRRVTASFAEDLGRENRKAQRGLDPAGVVAAGERADAVGRVELKGEDEVDGERNKRNGSSMKKIKE